MDIKSVLEAIEKILLGALKDSSVEAKLAVSGYITDATLRFDHYAQGALSGELSKEFVAERIKEEIETLKNQLLSISQIVGAKVNIVDLITLSMVIYETFLQDAINKSETIQ